MFVPLGLTFDHPTHTATAAAAVAVAVSAVKRCAQSTEEEGEDAPYAEADKAMAFQKCTAQHMHCGSGSRQSRRARPDLPHLSAPAIDPEFRALTSVRVKSGGGRQQIATASNRTRERERERAGERRKQAATCTNMPANIATLSLEDDQVDYGRSGDDLIRAWQK